MSDVDKQAIDQALRRGKPEEAIAASQRLLAAANNSREATIEVARVVAAVYRDLIAPPVHAYAEGIAKAIPGDGGATISKALGRLIRMTEDWDKRLWEVHTERLARELREWIRMRQIDPACANVARLMALAPAEQRVKRAQYIGATLGTVLNNQREAGELIQKLIRNPAQFYCDPASISAIEQARQQRVNQMVGVNLDTLERGFITSLTQVIVDIKNALPEPNKMDEPDEAALRDTGDVFRSILRVPLWREDAELFMDATNLFLEFVPKQQTTTAKVANVEARAYGALGYTAKKTVIMVFQDIGRNHFFTSIYKQWAKEFQGTDAIKPIVEFMGALRSPEFADFLQALRGDKKSEAPSAQVATALGSIAGAESSASLMNDLRTILARKRIETADIRDAENLITALGNIVKSPRTDIDERHRIQEFLRQHVPEDLTRVAITTVMQAFTYRPEEQHAQSRHWATRILARGLWSPDETTAHHKGGERQASELGFRAEMVDALVKLSGKEPHILTRAIEPMVMRYGASYMAAAELFEKINDLDFLPLLDRMLMNTLMHDESKMNTYQQEFFWDAASQSRKPITKEKLLIPIVHAIGIISGERAKEILRRYQEGITSHKFPPPPPQVAEFLQRFLGASVFSSAASEAAESAPAVTLGEDEVQELVKAITKGYLLTSKEARRMKKIEALTRLAQATPMEALDAVFEQLNDKDPLVTSAAITCISEYALMKKPKVLKDLAINGCIDRLASKDVLVRVGAQKTLREIGANRDDVKSRINGFVKNATPEERQAVAELYKGLALINQTPGETLASIAQAEGGTVAKKPGTDAMNKVELKRQYMQARQAWLTGGKKGDPPAMPDGLE
ncbi:hypothetical protein IT570_14535 [Candidatus Sumerlaeota bacterium]|nr:hypothetical protein [Candidatus Sumerlaeota bacterium]